jgi:hypothetical protein
MPYRHMHVRSDDGPTETFAVRIADAAVATWRRERPHLRTQGYPDRPPDVDTPTLRAWLARPGEQQLPYFRDHAGSTSEVRDPGTFPAYMAVWSSPYGTARLLVTGYADGELTSRVTLVNADGHCPVDVARPLPPDPELAWSQIESLVARLNETPVGWGPDDPLVTTYLDFLAFDAEVRVADAEARAAGLLASAWVH